MKMRPNKYQDDAVKGDAWLIREIARRTGFTIESTKDFYKALEDSIIYCVENEYPLHLRRLFMIHLNDYPDKDFWYKKEGTQMNTIDPFNVRATNRKSVRISASVTLRKIAKLKGRRFEIDDDGNVIREVFNIKKQLLGLAPDDYVNPYESNWGKRPEPPLEAENTTNISSNDDTDE